MIGIDPVAALNAIDLPLSAVTPQSAAPAQGSSFGDWIASGMSTVNSSVISAEKGVQQIALGQAGNLHDVMIRLEEARLSLQLLIQVKTRVLEAYQEILRMQV